MANLITDRDEAERVLHTLIARAHLTELLGPLTVNADSLDLLMLTHEDEETEVDLLDGTGQKVATLLVDLIADPVDGWDLRLRGWRLASDVAGI